MITLPEFQTLISTNPNGVVLLEGKRNIPQSDAVAATALAIALASKYPMLRFRSGNAPGADQAFSEGVAQVDPLRLEIVAPHEGHRRKHRIKGASYSATSIVVAAEEAVLADKTIKATPRNRSMIENRDSNRRLGAKAAYLIRDTLKVAGSNSGLEKPICGIFYVDSGDPLSGGTGHTIRVCRNEGVPVVFQKDWMDWIPQI